MPKGWFGELYFQKQEALKINLASLFFTNTTLTSVLLTDIPDREQGPSDARRLRLLERLSSRTVLARHPSAPDS